MWAQFYAGMEHRALPLFALVLFGLFFLGVLLFAARMKRPVVDALAAMPLGDDQQTPTSTPGARPKEAAHE